MSIFDLTGFRHHVGDYAGTSIVDQWESHVAKVGDKVFALLNTTGANPRIVVKCSEETFEILTSMEGIEQAPYFAKRKWVSISANSPLSEDEVSLYIGRSYATVAGGLTKKLRAELGITLNP